MRRILVVDDSPLIQSMLRILIARRLPEYQATIVTNGQEALQHINSRGAPDLILLDVNMPVMDGLTFMEHLRAAGLVEKVPVIIVSTEGKEEDVLRGLEAGAKGYLRKPFRAEDLYAIVKKILP